MQEELCADRDTTQIARFCFGNKTHADGRETLTSLRDCLHRPVWDKLGGWRYWAWYCRPHSSDAGSGRRPRQLQAEEPIHGATSSRPSCLRRHSSSFFFLSCLSHTRAGGGAAGGGSGGGSRRQHESVTWLKTWTPMSQSSGSVQTPISTCARLHALRCSSHLLAHFQW